MSEKPRSSVDDWANIQKMRDTDGWKLLMERYNKEGDGILTELLKLNICNEPKYGLRDLYAFQLDALARIGRVIEMFENEAKVANKPQPRHIGA